MNIKLISKALHTLSLLSDEDVAIVFGLRSASEDERSVLTLALEPNSKPQKKSSKKSAGGGGRGKSKHASSIAEKVGGTLTSIAKTVGGDDDNARKIINAMNRDDDSSSPRCQAKRSDGRICMLLPDHNIHHLATVHDYHQFQPAEQAAATSGD